MRASGGSMIEPGSAAGRWGAAASFGVMTSDDVIVVARCCAASETSVAVTTSFGTDGSESSVTSRGPRS
jgi:hypothetical protein